MHPTILKLGPWEIASKSIGPLTLNSYGMMVAIAILVGIFLAKRQARNEEVDARHVESMSFWIVISGLLGTRFLYTFVEHGDYYWKHPIEFFYFQSGGLAFYGALIFGFPTAYLYCKKKNLSLWQMLDLLAPSIALGVGIAKIGCFLAGCCHGKVCDLPWGVAFNHPDTLARPHGVPLHPSQLYETLAWTTLFFSLLGLRRIRKYYGELFLFCVITFSVVRSFLEIFRGSPGHLGALTTAQMLSIPIVLFCLFLWWMIRKKGWSHPVPA